MRVAFIGFQTWGLISLRAAMDAGHDVVFVASHPEDSFRAQTAFTDSVASYARKHGIHAVERRDLGQAEVMELRAARPDVLLASNWRRLVPPTVLSIFGERALNVHRSLLPAFAGVAPLNWAIECGAQESGVTIHQILPAEFDTGPIVGQRRIAIAPRETATSLFHKCTPVVESLVQDALRDLAENKLERIPQDLSMYSVYHSRGRAERRIDWSLSWTKVDGKIRAQSDPFPNAYCYVGDQEVAVKSSEQAQRDYRGTPSRVCAHTARGGAIVLCGHDEGAAGWQALEILSVQVAGDQSAVPASSVMSINKYLG